MARLMAGASVLLAASTPVAHAAQQVVRGRLFLVTDPSAGRSSKRHVLIHGADFPGTTTVVGDPLANGAMLLVVANGRTSTRQTFALPPGAFSRPNGPGWSRLVKRRRAIYTYVDERGENGPVTFLTIHQVASSFRVNATLEGRGQRRQVSIVPPNPGTDGVMVLSINGGDSYCVPFGGAAGGKITENDAETFRITHPRFKDCPEAP